MLSPRVCPLMMRDVSDGNTFEVSHIRESIQWSLIEWWWMILLVLQSTHAFDLQSCCVVYTALDSTYGDMMKSRGCSWGIGVVWLGHSQRYKMIIIARACCRRNHLQVRIRDIQCTVDEYKWQTFYCLQPTSGGLFHLLMRAIQSACLSVC